MFLGEHGEAVEADLLRFYRLDLAEVGTVRLSWRRLGVLIRQLPREAATVQAVAGADARWGDVEHLLAGIFDVLNVHNWQYAAAHAPKGKKPKRPKPLPRPGTKSAPSRRTRLTPAQIRARLEAQRRRG